MLRKPHQLRYGRKTFIRISQVETPNKVSQLGAMKIGSIGSLKPLAMGYRKREIPEPPASTLPFIKHFRVLFSSFLFLLLLVNEISLF
ncbi:hypothetical protein [Bacteroides bouchesdurhonensis]|uniref:hypothetical protein n=1 Tax=Bacteroides bouchesdurhonensis TaxID=1841855 RepID=UPI00370961AB